MKLDAAISCPACRNKLTVRLTALYPGNSRVCPRCGARITFTGDDGRVAQRQLDRAMDELERTFRNLNRRL